MSFGIQLNEGNNLLTFNSGNYYINDINLITFPIIISTIYDSSTLLFNTNINIDSTNFYFIFNSSNIIIDGNNKTIYINKTFHLNKIMKVKINVERKIYQIIKYFIVVLNFVH